MIRFFEAPDRLITLFEDEMRAAGPEFDYCDELIGFTDEKKDVVIPRAVAYYRMAREEKSDEAMNYFLGFFERKGLDDLVPTLIEDYADPCTWDATRRVIADCLYAIEAQEYVAEYIKAVTDTRLGTSRQKLIALLGKLKDERAMPALVELLEDESVRSHTLSALSKYKREELRPCFERFRDSDNPAWRKCAADGILALENGADESR